MHEEYIMLFLHMKIKHIFISEQFLIHLLFAHMSNLFLSRHEFPETNIEFPETNIDTSNLSFSLPIVQ